MTTEVRQAIEPLTSALDELKNQQTELKDRLTSIYDLVKAVSLKLDLLEHKAAPAKVTQTKAKPKVKAPEPEPEPCVDFGAPEGQENADLVQPADPAPEQKKKPVKQLPADPKPSKAKKAKAKPDTESKRPLNKMEFFNKAFDEDQTTFDQYITAADKQTIQDENPGWSELSGAELHRVKRAAYYHFMKNKHDSVLQSMKTTYVEKLAHAKVELLESH